MRRTLQYVSGLFLVFWAVAARAALPPSAVQDDTVLLVHIDLQKVDAAAARNAIRNLLGPQGAAIDPAVGLVQVVLESLTSTGLQAVTVSWSAPKSETDDAYYAVYLQLKAGADPAVVEKVVRQYWPDKDDAPAFERAGGYVVAHLHDQPLRPAGLPARAKVFAEAFALLRDRAIVIGFSPNARLRALAPIIPTAGLSDHAASLIPILLQSEWATIGVSLNTIPSIAAVLQAKDPASADAVMKLLRPTTAAAAASQPSDPVTVVASSIQLVRNGTKVAFELKGAGLARLISELQHQHAVPAPK